jgi:hypothetical protein
MEKLKFLLTSRKFWAALVGMAMIVIKAYSPTFPMTEAQVTSLVVIIVSYILGTAIEDGVSNIKPVIPVLNISPAVTVVPVAHIEQPVIPTTGITPAPYSTDTPPPVISSTDSPQVPTGDTTHGN